VFGPPQTGELMGIGVGLGAEEDGERGEVEGGEEGNGEAALGATMITVKMTHPGNARTGYIHLHNLPNMALT
jgi:hypothetical protein